MVPRMTESEHHPRLNKTLILAGLQCSRRLHLLRHPPPGFENSAPSDELRRLEGHRVHTTARQLFPHGVLVTEMDTDKALERTGELVRDPAVTVIFEGALEADGVLVRTDILERLSGNRWHLLEVKSSTKVSERHLYDLALQWHVLRGAGLRVNHCALVLLDRRYEYDGGGLNLNELFRSEDLTAEVRDLARRFPDTIAEFKRVLSLDGEPPIPNGVRCQTPVKCEYHRYCFGDLPDDHISLLPAIHARHVKELKSAGIESIRDIPDSFPFRQRQQNAREALQSGQPWFSPDLARILGRLAYPLYFMDFETYAPSIPCYPDMHPYGQLPFQWSVHVQPSPDAQLEHFEFLAENGADPREQFVRTLLETVGESGSVVVYNQSFESARLGELAERFPSLADRIENLQSRLWDLLPVVRRNAYHAAFRGSFSIKAVLPALAPEMTYSGMEVGDGLQAQLAWVKMECDRIPQVEKDQLRRSLLEYCCQDTLAMVQILERLEKEVPATGKTKRAGS